jgi:hypothetical protein
MAMSHALKVSSQQTVPAHRAGWRRTTLAANDTVALGVGEGPANALQQRLARAYPTKAEKWSPRRTLGFIMLTCGGFWLAVGLAVRAIFFH